MFKDKKTLALALIAFASLIGAMLVWRTNSVSSTTSAEEYHQSLRNALTEISIPTDGNRTSINSSVDNLANFVYYRSGIQISQANKITLQETEQKSWEQGKTLTQSQLTQLLTDVAFDKLVTLSDSDISSMAETLRGFNTPAYSAAYPNDRNYVRLRANGEGTMEPAHFVNQVKSVRDLEIAYRAEPTSRPIITLQMSRTALANRINNEIETRIGDLKVADTSFTGNSDALTPVKAMLLTYSVVTNDFIMGNQTELQQLMADKEQVSANYGGHFPNSQGYKAYGINGYIYSTPTNFLLDNSAVTEVLNLIKERSNIQ